MNRSSSKADIGTIRRGRALIHRFVPGDIGEIIEDARFEFDRVAIDMDHRMLQTRPRCRRSQPAF